MFEWIKTHAKDILIIIILLCVSLYLYYNINNQKRMEEELKQAQELTSEQAQSIEYLKNELKMKESDAKETVTIIKEAQNNQIPPTTSVTIQAPTQHDAVEKVIEDINNKEEYLPKEAIEDTDKTIVSEQPENEDYQVGVYKINTYRNWGVGTGIGTNNNDVYIPITVSRQYKKDRSIDFQVNLNPNDNMKINGVQVVHKWHF